MFKEKSIVPKYYRLKEWLGDYIISKGLKEKDKIPSEPELQNLTGLSLGTIRRSINELVFEGVLYREQGKGTFIKNLEYLKKKKIPNKKVGLILPEIRSFEKTKAVSIIAEDLRNYGFDLVLYLVRSEKDKKEIYNRILTEKPAGILTVAVVDRVDFEYLQKIYENNIPVVLINRKLKNLKLNFVGIDEKKVGYLATDYLIKKGFKKIGIIINEPHSNITELRLKGYIEALRKNNIKENPDFIFDLTLSPFEDTKEITYLKTREILNSKKLPEALFIMTFSGVLGVAKAIEEKNIPPDKFFLTTAIQNGEKTSMVRDLKGIVMIPNEIVYKKASEMLRNLIFNEKTFHEIIIQPEFYEIKNKEFSKV